MSQTLQQELVLVGSAPEQQRARAQDGDPGDGDPGAQGPRSTGTWTQEHGDTVALSERPPQNPTFRGKPCPGCFQTASL